MFQESILDFPLFWFFVFVTCLLISHAYDMRYTFVNIKYLKNNTLTLYFFNNFMACFNVYNLWKSE